MPTGLQFTIASNRPAAHGYYAVVRRTADGKAWNGTRFEDFDASHWPSYPLAYEDVGGEFWQLFVPDALLPAGVAYLFLQFEQKAPLPDPATDAQIGTDAFDNWGADNTGNAGPGADRVTLRFELSPSGAAIPDADVWVTADAAGLVPVAGPLRTNSAGEATFLLDHGVGYHRWLQKDGVNPIRGDAFTAERD